MLRRLIVSSTAAVVTLAAPLTITRPAAADEATAVDATVVPLQMTGPPASRFNLIVLGDGYTVADMPKFREQVDKHLNVPVEHRALQVLSRVHQRLLGRDRVTGERCRL